MNYIDLYVITNTGRNMDVWTDKNKIEIMYDKNPQRQNRNQ